MIKSNHFMLISLNKIMKQSGLERKVRDSCGKSASRGDTAGKAEEAPRPPAESECLKWKSTFTLYKP